MNYYINGNSALAVKSAKEWMQINIYENSAEIVWQQADKDYVKDIIFKFNYAHCSREEFEQCYNEAKDVMNGYLI